MGVNSTKTAVSDLINRYIWLVTTVQNAKSITYEEICRKWEVSSTNTSHCKLTLRTFHNYRHAVAELFGIDIKCDKHNGWKYYLDEDLSKDNSLKLWLLSSLAVSSIVRDAQELQENILLEDIPSGVNYLPQILQAIRDHNKIRAVHVSFWRDAKYEVEMEPYCVKIFKRRWYVVGYDTIKGAMMTYSLDRLLDCTTLPEQFEVPADFDGKTYFADYYGVYVDPTVQMHKVVLEADEVRGNYLRSLPMHHSQREIERNVFELHLRPTKDFLQELRAMEESVRVVEMVEE